MNTDKQWLDMAYKYAIAHSGCQKVSVGCVIVKDVCGTETIASMGANRTLPQNCKSMGCWRKQIYGDDSKAHRGPADCMALHSEIDALTMAARNGVRVSGSTVYVTRYPCEACARALAAAGVAEVIYGGTTKASILTEHIFSTNFIKVRHITDWMEDNSDR